ncbi:hypothetical protein V9K67_20715 [Paraflavisolibacter sp. H34]
MYALQLTRFLQAIKGDGRIGPTHICIYLAIIQAWSQHGFVNPVSVTRIGIMEAAKISAKATYHKCMNELQDFGYIRYIPSRHPIWFSLVFLYDLNEKQCL